MSQESYKYTKWTKTVFLTDRPASLLPSVGGFVLSRY